MTANAAAVLSFIQRARTRRLILSSLTDSAIGLTIGVAIGLITQLLTDERGAQLTLLALGVAGLVIGGTVGLWRVWRSSTPLEIERRAPESRNVVITAAEIIAAEKTDPYVADLVTTRAAVTVRSLDAAALFPSGKALLAIASAAAVWVASIGFAARRDPVAPVTFGALPVADEVGSIEVTITPPAYTKRPVQRLTNPARIEAIAGSRIALVVRGIEVRVETVEGDVPAVSGRPGDPGTGSGFIISAHADGFIAVRAGASARRLIGLTVTPDQNPRVRVTAPGKDMFLADARRRIPVEIDARDDLGLTAVKLRYTKVSGSGERFTFIEGELPVTVERTNDRDWRARATLDLSALELEQGDVVVYRGAAADARPGAPLTESDAFLVEITSPLSMASEGFSLDDQQDKYALSQQMVILKTERLLARAASLPADSLTHYSQSLAAEQRAVRAEFVFMMGGEVAEEVIAAAGLTDIDETHEAENEGELAAGRMVNRGRVALVEAIRLMSRASSRLNEGDPKAALPIEKSALVALQDAFSRTRYLLRALTLRERLDLSRRLTGVLTLASRDARPAESAPIDPALVSLRRSLAAIATLASSRHPERDEGPAFSSTTTAIAQDVLAVDPSDSTLQAVASRLQQAALGERAQAWTALDGAATLLTAAIRARTPRDEPSAESPDLRRLRGSLADALRGLGTP